MSRARVINVISIKGGRLGLTTCTKLQTLRSMGTSNVMDFRPATQRDVDWVKNMGGHVPEGRIQGEKK